VALLGGLLAALDQLAQASAQTVATTDDVDADRLLQAATRLREQMALEQAEQCADFALRPLPVAGRERVQRQHADAATCGSLDDCVERGRAGAMPGGSRQVASRRPAAVAVHDDCDVHWRVLYVAELYGKFFYGRRVALITASTWSR